MILIWTWSSISVVIWNQPKDYLAACHSMVFCFPQARGRPSEEIINKIHETIWVQVWCIAWLDRKHTSRHLSLCYLYFQVFFPKYMWEQVASFEKKKKVKPRTFEPCVKQVCHRMHKQKRSPWGLRIMFTWNTVCRYESSRCTHMPVSFTLYAEGSSHNLLSENPPWEGIDSECTVFWEGRVVWFPVRPSFKCNWYRGVRTLCNVAGWCKEKLTLFQLMRPTCPQMGAYLFTYPTWRKIIINFKLCFAALERQLLSSNTKSEGQALFV